MIFMSLAESPEVNPLAVKLLDNRLYILEKIAYESKQIRQIEHFKLFKAHSDRLLDPQ